MLALGFLVLSMAPGLPQEAREPQATNPTILDARILRAVHLDLLGRPPLRAETEAWNGKPLADLLDQLVDSLPFWQHWFEEQLYYFFLIDNFRPRGEELAALPVELERGRSDPRAATHQIALCSSFEQRNPGADTYVTVVMEQIAGMKVQSNVRELEVGKRIYDGASGLFLGSTGKSQADIVRIAIDSPRFARTFIEREYRRLLHADAPQKELGAWARRFEKDPKEYRDLVRAWLLSPAYLERLARREPLTNRLFVQALHVDLCDQLPDADGARRLRVALDGLADPRPLRAVLAKLLLDSGKTAVPARAAVPDATAWLRELFPRLLGRAASQEELSVFARAMDGPACSPTLVVYALVSCPEYHTY